VSTELQELEPQQQLHDARLNWYLLAGHIMNFVVCVPSSAPNRRQKVKYIECGFDVYRLSNSLWTLNVWE
jgi:hypothetical protein